MLLNLSLRNLFRQKRRNLMLGIAIGLGVTILIMASSFSRGIEDIMFNKIVTYVAGHVSVNMNEGLGKRVPVFRDKERLFSIIKKNVEQDAEIDESFGVFTRAIGNGKADNMILVAIDTSKRYTEERKKEVRESFNVIGGSLLDIGTSAVANAVILSRDRAESLNVKKNDVISIRFRNVFGQNQSERLTVVGVLQNDNIFMQGVMFCELKNVKAMMGYRPYECANIHIKIKDPKENAVRVADKIHSALTPGPAFIAGKLSYLSSESEVVVIPFRGDDDSIRLIGSSFELLDGKMDDVLLRDGVMISSNIADKLGVKPSSEVLISYNAKFEKERGSFKVQIKGVFKSDVYKGDNTIYMHEALFYPKFYDRIPDLDKERARVSLPEVLLSLPESTNKDRSNTFLPEDLNKKRASALGLTDQAYFKSALGNEWELLDRTRNTDEMRKKYAAQARKKIRATTMDVNSMYESASDVLKLESVLNIITLWAVLILFFIILIGVVNTLRMTIKERTREIGTIRAIGMQKRDVWGIFMIETSLLSLFASFAGTLFAFVLMWLLTLIRFNVTDNPLGILLVSNHLYFLPTFGSVLLNITLILVITVITAYFPARRAANLSSAEALRHYE
ncbi:MAG: FtsX-like permease family protein [Desulfamplus sp.]|nr:FtsX-like permease family protein [Desulfamplus sp.]